MVVSASCRLRLAGGRFNSARYISVLKELIKAHRQILLYPQQTSLGCKAGRRSVVKFQVTVLPGSKGGTFSFNQIRELHPVLFRVGQMDLHMSPC